MPEIITLSLTAAELAQIITALERQTQIYQRLSQQLDLNFDFSAASVIDAETEDTRSLITKLKAQ